MKDFFQTVAAYITATCLMELGSGIVQGILGKWEEVRVHKNLGIKIGDTVRGYYNS